MSGVNLDDYVDVAERIRIFREKYPDGSLALADPTAPYRVLTVGDLTYVVVVAAAYRNPDDPRPGIGIAQELIPGKSNFTKGSELQNAETSAWGRAIVASLAADTKKVASQDEVRNRQAEREPEPESDRAALTNLDAKVLLAKTEDAFREVWRAVAQSRTDGLLTATDAVMLQDKITARKEELVPA